MDWNGSSATTTNRRAEIAAFLQWTLETDLQLFFFCFLTQHTLTILIAVVSNDTLQSQEDRGKLIDQSKNSTALNPLFPLYHNLELDQHGLRDGGRLCRPR